MKLTFDQKLDQAHVAFQKNNFREAENIYQDILLLEPNHSATHHSLGITLYKLRRLDEAIKCLKRSIELNPDYLSAYYDLGNLLQEQGKFDEAVIHYKKGVRSKPNFIQLYSNLGGTLDRLGKLDEAVFYYKQGIKLNPNIAEVYYNLGIVLNRLNKFEEAEINYKKAIDLKKDYIDSYNNLGNVLIQLNKSEEAEIYFKKIIAIDPTHVTTYCNLAIMLQDLNRSDEALINFNKAIELKHDYFEALIGRGQNLFDKGKFELALRDFDLCNTKDSKQRSLTALYALGRYKEIYKRIEKFSKLKEENLRVAAFSSFISYKQKKKTKNKFCINPIDFIYCSNLESHFKNSGLFINDLIKELDTIETMWEPSGKTNNNGFQSSPKLFENHLEKISSLKSLIVKELDLYYLKFKNESCTFIEKWPFKKNIYGWHVILKKQGYQNPHIHASGWLSGVIYLKVVPALEKNEGAIEFSLNGQHYSDINSPKLIHQPKIGDIVLFPSSLHHRTIPFTTNTDRIVISFDLIPES